MACGSNLISDLLSPSDQLESASILRSRSRKCLEKLDIQANSNVSSEGYPQDYSGLAELMGFTQQEVELVCAQFPSKKTLTLLDKWSTKDGSTIQKLLQYLSELERDDLLESNLIKFIAEDVRSHKERVQLTAVQPVNVHAVSSSTGRYSTYYPNDSWEITGHDVMSAAPTMYDAFVIMDADNERDMAIADLIVKYCEEEKGLRLCMLHRDEIGGLETDDVLQCLIETRSRHILVLLSKSSVENEQCQKQIKMAKAAHTSHGQRIIPVLCESCCVPLSLRFLTPVNYNTKAAKKYFKRKLLASIQSSSSQTTIVEFT